MNYFGISLELLTSRLSPIVLRPALMPRNNLDTLTQSHNAIAAKKKAKREQIKEILFDDEARREFLTGFHKRKLAKAEAARSKAKEREKQERLEARREQRRMLREQAAENSAQVEKAYGAIFAGQSDDEEEWIGVQGSSSTKEQEREYEDEEVLATVTVVEDFDLDTLIHGPSTTPTEPTTIPDVSTSKPHPVIPKPRPTWKVERTKQRGRRKEKAELAGGKASRKAKSHRKGNK